MPERRAVDNSLLGWVSKSAVLQRFLKWECRENLHREYRQSQVCSRR